MVDDAQHIPHKIPSEKQSVILIDILQKAEVELLWLKMNKDSIVTVIERKGKRNQ